MTMISPFQVVRDFERALCEYTGAPYAVSTTSCTMALTLAVAYHLDHKAAALGPLLANVEPAINIPRRTYVGVPYAIRAAGGRPTFRDQIWGKWGFYKLAPLPVWDAARWFTTDMWHVFEPGDHVCVSFHWSKTLGIGQGGAILHDNPAADEWLRRARFDGRAEGVAPALDAFPLRRAWHAYMSPDTAAEGLMRIGLIPKKNDPIPAVGYPDLAELETFK